KVKGAVNVDFTEQKTEANYVETAVMFAKDFSRLTAEQVNQLKELLKKFESSGEYQDGSVSV
nr:transcriptional regulator [Treponema sp.]